MESLYALTALDGRYKKVTEQLRDDFSEYGLIKTRVLVEVRWVQFLSKELKLFAVSNEANRDLEEILSSFSLEEASKIKEIEKTTNHDVKAVEYYLKQELEKKGLGDIKEWVHFSCTSADINNTSYALMIKNGKKTIVSQVEAIVGSIEQLAKQNKSVAMMSRTHGQAATPTTVGKEFINFAWRLKEELENLKSIEIEAKLNGATGNFNAHHFAFPEIDWITSSYKFLKEYLGVRPLMLTTQINPNNYIAEVLHSMARMASIIIDFDRDMWGYISLGYFRQKLKEGEVGSSTMPHKVNPIDFENSEGNLGLAISLMDHLAVKLLNSRFQRDLTDSTVMRNLGSVFGYILLGLSSAQKGIGKIDIDEERILNDLNMNWELLAEPIQTVMRVYGEENPYEKLKELTRGSKINKEELARFIEELEKVPDDVKKRMKALTPATYVGLAEELVDQYFK